MNNETLILKSAVATNSDIAITDLPFANVDALEGAKHFLNESFEGVKTFKSAKTGATAFGTATVKGDEVPIVIGSSEIYDEQFKYGIYADGQIKTADEIFSADQNGNYDISDYPAIPATTLLERLETFPAGSNNTIRINKDTAARYVEGFRFTTTTDVGWLPKSQNDRYQYYTTGSFSIGDTFNETITDSLSFKGGKVEMLPGDTITIVGQGGNAPRKYCVVIGGIVNAIAPNDDSAIFTYTAIQSCTIYFAIQVSSNYEVSATLTKKLDYIVARANSKGYDVTIANNESDIKLIEKVEFDGAKYIDTGIDINGIELKDVSASIDTSITDTTSSKGLITATTYGSANSFCLFFTVNNGGNYQLISSDKSVKSTYSPQIQTSTVFNKRNIFSINNNTLVFNNIYSAYNIPNYTIEADNTTKIGCRHYGAGLHNGLIGNVFYCLILDNLFIPANNGTTDGMINLKDMSFHPLIPFN